MSLDPVGIFDAKSRLSELVDRVAGGEEIVITRRGLPVARLVPDGAAGREFGGRLLVARIRAGRAERPSRGRTSLRALIEEGRR